MNPNLKKFYSYDRSKLKLDLSFAPLCNDNKKPLVSDFDKVFLFNKYLKKIL